jgi:hypothetical protein
MNIIKPLFILVGVGVLSFIAYQTIGVIAAIGIAALGLLVLTTH